jgi:hypothetical protein
MRIQVMQQESRPLAEQNAPAPAAPAAALGAAAIQVHDRRRIDCAPALSRPQHPPRRGRGAPRYGSDEQRHDG